ncbi:MAG: choice-of-anchor L domain-containing protein, partial [Flavobacteriaceae bacterium]|nr:choice-of-anchor L domain-containing protein [Flavobacteriaceae bacterium]
MRNFQFFTAFLLFTNFLFGQSIIVNPTGAPESNMDAETLTVEVLIDGGDCSAIENFQVKQNSQAMYPNVNRSWGYFEKGNSNFPFEKGIVLTTGYATEAQGPSNGGASQGNNSWIGDSDANTLAVTGTNNATIFEFDFIPQASEIKFNYIFASEEYVPAYACTYNDVFGFIISGPGIVNDPGLSGKNIALLPNGLPVTIKNVNNFGCGDPTYYVPGPFPYIRYDGRTATLTAQSAVIPGQTYHIRLLVADAMDSAFDSAVFLEAGSFKLGGTIVDLNGVELGDNEIICGLTEYTMSVNVEATGVQFQWYFNGVLIPGATNQQYTATQSGTYSVVVSSGTCQKEVFIDLNFSDVPEISPTPVEDSKCDDSGSFVFNLTDYNSQISTTPGVQYTYYTTQNGAQNEIPADQILNFTNYPVTGAVTVWVRVENADGCYAVAELHLEVKPNPIVNPQLYTEKICDENVDNVIDGIYNMDLNTITPFVLANPANYTVRYYTNLTSAQAGGTDNITGTFSFTGNTSVWIRVEADESCVTIKEIPINIGDKVALVADTADVVICNNDLDSTEDIDLANYISLVYTGTVTVIKYYETLENAQNDVSAIGANQSISGDKTFYYRIEAPDGFPVCDNIATLNFIFSTPSPSPVLLPTYTTCEDKTIVLDPGPGYASYLWNTGAATQTIT